MTAVRPRACCEALLFPMSAALMRCAVMVVEHRGLAAPVSERDADVEAPTLSRRMRHRIAAVLCVLLEARMLP